MDQILEKYKKVIEGTDQLIRENKVPYFVAIMSANPQVKAINEGSKEVNCSPKNLDECEPQKTIKDLFEEKNIKSLDTLSSFMDLNNDKYFFLKDGHATREGVEKYTDSIFDYLIGDFNILSKITK